jgi:hypothetical protein
MNRNWKIVFVALNFVWPYQAQCQSSFWLNNHDTPVVNAPVFDSLGGLLEGPNYVAELWGGVTPGSLTPALAFFSHQRVFVPFLSGSGAGIFRDLYLGRGSADHPTVLGVPPYTGTAWLEVRAWDVRLGATYEDVVVRGLGGYGESPLFAAHGSDPTALQSLPAPLIGLQSFSLHAVPEPSTLALVACGGLAVWWAARRRRGRHVKLGSHL